MSENDIKPVALDRWKATGDYAFPAEEDAEGEFVCYDDAVEVIDALNNQISELKTMLSIAEFQRKEMQSERDAAVADAERYRWLRNRCNHIGGGLHIQFSSNASEADAAIDAARAEVRA